MTYRKAEIRPFVAADEPLRLELAAFLQACRANGPAPVDARAGLHVVEVVEAAARAARLGRTVTLAEIRSA